MNKTFLLFIFCISFLKASEQDNLIHMLDWIDGKYSSCGPEEEKAATKLKIQESIEKFNEYDFQGCFLLLFSDNGVDLVKKRYNDEKSFSQVTKKIFNLGYDIYEYADNQKNMQIRKKVVFYHYKCCANDFFHKMITKDSTLTENRDLKNENTHLRAYNEKLKPFKAAYEGASSPEGRKLLDELSLLKMQRNGMVIAFFLSILLLLWNNYK